MPSNPTSSQQQRGRPSFMPLVHQARRTIRNRQDGNPFATEEVIADLIEALGTAYLAAPSGRVSRAIKVELDLLETLI